MHHHKLCVLLGCCSFDMKLCNLCLIVLFVSVVNSTICTNEFRLCSHLCIPPGRSTDLRQCACPYHWKMSNGSNHHCECMHLVCLYVCSVYVAMCDCSNRMLYVVL